MKNIAIVGSRSFNNYDLLEKTLKTIYKNNKIGKIISGGASGADTMAERFAKENNIPTEIFLPDWNKYGKSAGFIRNKDIIEAADFVFIFWDGKSKGTKHDIELCFKYKKSHLMIFFNKPTSSSEKQAKQ